MHCTVSLALISQPVFSRELRRSLAFVRVWLTGAMLGLSASYPIKTTCTNQNDPAEAASLAAAVSTPVIAPYNNTARVLLN